MRRNANLAARGMADMVLHELSMGMSDDYLRRHWRGGYHGSRRSCYLQRRLCGLVPALTDKVDTQMDLKIPKFDELKDRLGIRRLARDPGMGLALRRALAIPRDDAVDYGRLSANTASTTRPITRRRNEPARCEIGVFTRVSCPSSSRLTTCAPISQYTPSEARETADAPQATRPNRDFGAPRGRRAALSRREFGLFDPTPAPAATGAGRGMRLLLPPRAAASSRRALMRRRTGAIPLRLRMPAVAG